MDTILKNMQSKQNGLSGSGGSQTLFADSREALPPGAGGPYVSIFMPLHEAGTDIRQDGITLGHLLRQGHELLVERGLSPSEADKLLEPVSASLAEAMLQQYPGSGLVILASQDSFSHFSVPIHLVQQVIVGNHFQIRPLLPLIMGQQSFYVLALSLNKVRLVRSTRYSCTELRLPVEIPRSLAETLKYDEFGMQHQFYSGTPGWSGASAGGTSRPGAVFYGQEVGSDVKKANILRYLQQIDKGLHSLLKGERAPVVLAGVGSLLSMYREVTGYRHLVEETLEGNPDHKAPEQLRREAWNIVQPIFERSQHDAANLYMQLKGTGETSNDVAEIVPAAYNGRIDTLLVAEDVQQWGSFDPYSGAVSLHDTREAGDEDLLDLAVMYTLSNSGAAYALEHKGMPDGSPVAALLRY